MREKYRQFRWLMLALVLSGSGFGCVHGKFLPAVRENFQAVPHEKVVVRLSGCPAKAKIIGSVILDAGEPITQSGMVDRLRAEAGRGGGHGICEIRYRKTKGGSLLPGAGEYDPSGFKGATCKVFRFQ